MQKFRLKQMACRPSMLILSHLTKMVKCHGNQYLRIIIYFVILPFSDDKQFQGFPGGTEVKNQPAMQEMQVRSLGQEDPLEKEMATHSSNLAWKISWTEESGVSPWGCRVRHS